MVVEPGSLCWAEGRKADRRDGATWAETFGHFPALRYVVTDGGVGLRKGIDLIRAARGDGAGAVPLDQGLDVFHTLREGRHALRATWRAVAVAIDRAGELDRAAGHRGRRGRSRRGYGTAAAVAWRRAERLWDRAEATEAAWDRARSALEPFTPEGRLRDRSAAEAALAEAMPHLAGPAWAKARRLLGRAESLAFLDRIAEGLAGLDLPAEVLAAILDREGLARRAGPADAAARARATIRAVQLSKADPNWCQSAARVRGVLRRAWRASSAVEGLNSVARMQQSRHRKMTQGLLDLKRLYWNLRRFRTGPRKGKAPYQLLGQELPTWDWWELLKMPPEQLRQHLSAMRVAA
jgi:hypothetical protein